MNLRNTIVKGLADLGIENAEQRADDAIRDVAAHVERNKDRLGEDIAEIARRCKAGCPPTEAEVIQMAKDAARLP